MTWTALVPLKPPGERKRRLAERLAVEARASLGGQLFAHVAAELRNVPQISSIVLLSKAPPEGWTGAWRADLGRGLNGELDAAREALGIGPLLVIHADLPLLTGADVSALLAAAEAVGLAIAPDHNGTGTNALAIADGRRFSYRFGVDSFPKHRAEAGERYRVVERRGLALDLDTPDDLDAAIAEGFEPLQG